jgi:hypothetical protein
LGKKRIRQNNFHTPGVPLSGRTGRVTGCD